MNDNNVIYEVSNDLLTEICEITCDEWYSIFKFTDMLYNTMTHTTIKLEMQKDGLHVKEVK